MKLLTTNNAKKGVMLTLKLLVFLFTGLFAFIDIVFGDSGEYDDENNNGSSEEYKRYHNGSYSEFSENVNHLFK